MNKEEIRRGMENLWKRTFHDSEDYIKLLFDAYFDLDYIEFEEKNGEIVAGLIATPYIFTHQKGIIRAAYLCGLSTDERYRSQGIMSHLLDKIERKMESKGYALTFLIPADEGLNVFYKDRGYANAFYRTELHFTSIHDFIKDSSNEKNKGVNSFILIRKNGLEIRAKGNEMEAYDASIYKNIDELEAEEIAKIIAYIENSYEHTSGMVLAQTKQQIEVFLREAVMSEDEILICKNENNQISGVAIYSIHNDEIIEKERYVNPITNIKLMRNIMQTYHPDKSMTVIYYGKIDYPQESLWEPSYIGVLATSPQSSEVKYKEDVYNINQHSKIYGMAKILRISEILKFSGSYKEDGKYSILMRYDNNGKIMKYSYENGKLKEDEIRDKNGIMNAGTPIIKEKELAELLFRRPGAETMIEEIFGLPALNGKISMLLD